MDFQKGELKKNAHNTMEAYCIYVKIKKRLYFSQRFTSLSDMDKPEFPSFQG